MKAEDFMSLINERFFIGSGIQRPGRGDLCVSLTQVLALCGRKEALAPGFP